MKNLGKAVTLYNTCLGGSRWKWGLLQYKWNQTVRCIFSKTGIWNPQWSHNQRLEIEEYWRPRIQRHDENNAESINTHTCENQEKFYALSMFPYPSGNLHLGHVRVYTISDVIARYQRSKGKLVIHPMGWDAFGLPAENAARERGIHPKEWTYSNIKKMKEQLQSFTFSFDWKREIATCDPQYYRWTQYIFLKMFENGLAFQKKGLVNWDPVDLTVLADEQIDGEGCSWRSGAKVEKKYLTQWYLRNTTFSQALLDGLEDVDPSLWQDIILLQKHWISECKGHRIDFRVHCEPSNVELPLSVYTENLDLIYGVSHLCIKPSHHLCVDLGVHQIDTVLPAFAVHPFTGEQLKLVVTDENLMYPNRDVMLAIPCISDEDKAVAERLYISYKNVLDTTQNIITDSSDFSGLSREEAVEQIRAKAMALGIGGEKVSERLNDWLISRQRYWGTPIPIIHCDKCGSVPVPYDELPVELPEIDGIASTGGRSPLAEVKEWLHVACPRCGSDAQRETDTMDTFVDSTWYFLRYLDPSNKDLPFDPHTANKLMPVDLYVGGKEHAVLHLYFARFVCHFLQSIGLLENREPFINLLTQGMVKGESFKLKSSGKYIPRDQVDFSGKVPVCAASGEELLVEWEKMSKSKHNGVSPEEVVAEYGVDATRLCILSNVSPQSERNWSNIVYKGVLTWQGRVWSLVSHQRSYITEKAEGNHSSLNKDELDKWEEKINDTRNHIVNNVNFQFEETFNINSAISRLHSYVSWLLKVPAEVAGKSEAYERALADLVVMVSPMAPHFACELWAGLADVAQYNTHQWNKTVLEQPWPRLDDSFLMPMLCKVNGVDVCEVGVPYKIFNTLDTATALAFLKEDSVFLDKFSQYRIDSASVRVTKDYKASLSVNMPDYDFQIEAKSSTEKKKKMKKLGKQRKKLHTMDSTS